MNESPLLHWLILDDDRRTAPSGQVHGLRGLHIAVMSMADDIELGPEDASRHPGQGETRRDVHGNVSSVPHRGSKCNDSVSDDGIGNEPPQGGFIAPNGGIQYSTQRMERRYTHGVGVARQLTGPRTRRIALRWDAERYASTEGSRSQNQDNAESLPPGSLQWDPPLRPLYRQTSALRHATIGMYRAKNDSKAGTRSRHDERIG